MRIVSTLDILAPTLEASWFSPDAYESLRSVDVSEEDHDARLFDVIQRGLERGPHAGADWWIADLTSSESGSLVVKPREPGPGYGVTSDGRLLMDTGYQRLTVAEYLRAVESGYYQTESRDLVLVPPAPSGGKRVHRADPP